MKVFLLKLGYFVNLIWENVDWVLFTVRRVFGYLEMVGFVIGLWRFLVGLKFFGRDVIVLGELAVVNVSCELI